jgi:undecaprenyl diphosphate synthase
MIMDGNGRWAKARGLPRTAGHREGAKTVRLMMEACLKHHIPVLSLFAFSTENWKRPKREVSTLMKLFLTHLKKEMPLFIKHNIRCIVIGDRSVFSQELQAQIEQTEKKTSAHSAMTLVLAVNYGGRQDILNATKLSIPPFIPAKTGIHGPIDPSPQSNVDNKVEEISEEAFTAHLSLGHLPPPDLLIRTGGQQRLSNFFLWQMAYTELYFTNVYWPDFAMEDFEKALEFFKIQQRNFGAVDEA